MGVAAQLSLHFPGAECVTWKKQKRWISPTPFDRFSSSFHQNDRTVAGRLILVTYDLENVGQGQNLKKI